MGGPKRAKPGNVDAYIAALSSELRPTLEELRAIIRALVPDAVETISYGIIAYKHLYMLVGIGVTRRAVSLYTMSPGLVAAMKDQLGGEEVSGATIHFKPGAPLPTTLIGQVVAARVQENEERAASSRR